MTSPAQLKYLDAIGIPVWVSRDRLIKPAITKQNLSTESDCIGSVDDIMQTLDNTNKENLTVVPNTENKLVPPSEKTSEDIPKKATINLKPTGTHINEIGRSDQHTLYACGNLNADWLIIGESPEANEDRNYQPFSANSGNLLTNMLKSIGLQNPREDAYLINIVKEASLSADPVQSSLAINKLLNEKIASIKPKIILIVGQVSAQNLLQSTEPLARLRSKSHTLPNTDIPIVVTYYPSYLLTKPSDKRKAWNDLKLALSCYKTN